MLNKTIYSALIAVIMFSSINSFSEDRDSELKNKFVCLKDDNKCDIIQIWDYYSVKATSDKISVGEFLLSYYNKGNVIEAINFIYKNKNDRDNMNNEIDSALQIAKITETKLRFNVTIHATKDDFQFTAQSQDVYKIYTETVTSGRYPEYYIHLIITDDHKNKEKFSFQFNTENERNAEMNRLINQMCLNSNPKY